MNRTSRTSLSLRSLQGAVRRRLADRVSYRRGVDWWLGVYNRMLLRLPSLPFRGRLCEIAPIGMQGTIRVRLGTSDWHVFEELFVRRDYEPALALCPNARTVLDLGANIGLSVRLWQEAYPGARVIAVEPDLANLAVCEHNAAAGRTVLIRACAAGRSGVSYLDRSNAQWAYRMSTRAEGEPIQALTVPEILRIAGIDGEIDLLKCDIEGAEAEVFGTCQPWIERVRTMVIETHTPYTGDQFLRDVGPRFELHARILQGPAELLFVCRRA